MLNSKKTTWLLIICILSIMVLNNSILAQDKKKCMFVSAEADPGDTRDEILINHLKETYDITSIVDDDDVKNGVITVEDCKANDFVFVSESGGSGKTKPLKGAPVPVFYTEGYAGKPQVSGWCSSAASWGTSVAGKIKIVDATGHPLAAGYAADTEIDVVSGSSLFYPTPLSRYFQILPCVSYCFLVQDFKKTGLNQLRHELTHKKKFFSDPPKTPYMVFPFPNPSSPTDKGRYIEAGLFSITPGRCIGALFSTTPSLQYSITPLFQCGVSRRCFPSLHHSITPILHYSFIPLLHHSTTPLFLYSITPSFYHLPPPVSPYLYY